MMDQETSSGTSSSGTDSDDDDLPLGGAPAVYCTNCTSRLVLGTVCMVSCLGAPGIGRQPPTCLQLMFACFSEWHCHCPFGKLHLALQYGFCTVHGIRVVWLPQVVTTEGLCSAVKLRDQQHLAAWHIVKINSVRRPAADSRRKSDLLLSKVKWRSQQPASSLGMMGMGRSPASKLSTVFVSNSHRTCRQQRLPHVVG